MIFAANVLIPHANGILLIRRAQHKAGGGLWAIPGGKLDEGETFVQAAARELFEETGILVLEAQLEVVGQAIAGDGALVRFFLAPAATNISGIRLKEDEADAWGISTPSEPLPMAFDDHERVFQMILEGA